MQAGQSQTITNWSPLVRTKEGGRRVTLRVLLQFSLSVCVTVLLCEGVIPCYFVLVRVSPCVGWDVVVAQHGNMLGRI